MGNDLPLDSDPELISDDPSARDHITRLVADFRGVAADEISYYRARLAYSSTVAKWTGIYVAIALFALFGTVVALILGLLLILSTWIGAPVATLVVTLGFAAVALIFAQMARHRARNLSFPELMDANRDG